MTDTTPPNVLTSRTRWWAWLMAAAGLLVLVAIAVLSLLPSSLVAQAHNARLDVDQPAPYARVPASAESVADRVAFANLPVGVEQYPPDGDIYFVTVAAPTQSVLSWLAGRNDPAVEFITREDKYGTRTPTQVREINLQAMSTAEQKAQFVAFTKLGLDAEVSLGEVIVEEILCIERADDGTCAVPFPSDEQIDPADKIVAVDGVPIASVDDLSAALEGKEPGDTVRLEIERAEVGDLSVDVELSAAPDDPDRTIIGFRPFDTRVVTLPFDASIDTGAVGGPSAGLAFTLTLIDELSPGNLTGDETVAVTGTIDLDGNVGAIGGLAQKVNAVHQRGVEHFLVPASQSELNDPEEYQRLLDAGRGEVEIIPVANVDEALAALEALGGDPLVPIGD